MHSSLRRNVILVGVAFVVVLFIGWRSEGSRLTDTNSTTPEDNDRLQVVTSFYPLYFLTTEIAGDTVDVYNLTPAGAEPHDYEPTAQDMVRLEESDVVIVNGGVESWWQKIRPDLEAKQIVVVEVGNGLLTLDGVDEEGHSEKDPHIWLSPRLAGRMAASITDTLIRARPEQRMVYDTNLTKLQASLTALDREFHQGLASCRQKTIVTAHTAFGYLAAEYGLEQVGIAGISPEEEPTPRALADIVTLVREKQITHIFFEELVSPKLSETIAAETGAKTLALNPLEGLTDDDLAQGKNYITAMQQNLMNLQTALQCQ